LADYLLFQLPHVKFPQTSNTDIFIHSLLIMHIKMLSVHCVSPCAVAINCCHSTHMFIMVSAANTNSCHGTTHRQYTRTRQNKNAWCEFAQTWLQSAFSV